MKKEKDEYRVVLSILYPQLKKYYHKLKEEKKKLDKTGIEPVAFEKFDCHSD